MWIAGITCSPALTPISRRSSLRSAFPQLSCTHFLRKLGGRAGDAIRSERPPAAHDGRGFRFAGPWEAAGGLSRPPCSLLYQPSPPGRLGFEALAGVAHQAPINGAAVRDPIGHPKCAKPPTKLGEGYPEPVGQGGNCSASTAIETYPPLCRWTRLRRAGRAVKLPPLCAIRTNGGFLWSGYPPAPARSFIAPQPEARGYIGPRILTLLAGAFFCPDGSAGTTVLRAC